MIIRRLYLFSLLVMINSLNCFCDGDALIEFLNGFKEIDLFKGTWLYFTDRESCINCNINNLEKTIETHRKLSPDNNQVLIVKNIQDIEKKFFGNKFKIKYVIADEDGLISKRLNPASKLSIFLEPNKIAAKLPVQNHNDDSSFIRLSKLLYNKDKIKIIDDQTPIIRSFKALIDKATGTVSILDDIQNAIFFIDFNTGKIIHQFLPDNNLKYFIYKDTLNSIYKKMFDRHAEPVLGTIYHDPVNNSLNSLAIVYSVQVTIKYNEETKTLDTLVKLMPNVANVKFVMYNQNEIKLILAVDDYSIYKNIIATKSSLICERDIYQDSIYSSKINPPIFYSINKNFDSIRSILSSDQLKIITGCKFDFHYAGSFAYIEGGIFYYLNPENSVFIKCSNPPSDSLKVVMIKPDGILKKMFRYDLCDSNSKNQNSNDHIVLGMDHLSDKLFIYICRFRENAIVERILQVYKDDKLFSESIINDEIIDDSLATSSFIGIFNGELIILDKWKKSRWVISKIKI